MRWQPSCDVQTPQEEALMLESVRRLVAMPQVSPRVLIGLGTLGSFLWLLAHDLVHPIVIYALELYLTF
jgi:hypothetical protein